MKPIPGYDGYFLTELDGKFQIIGKRGRPMTLSDSGSTHKYLACNTGRQKGLLYLHRAVALVYHGEPPFPGAQVDHIDRNPKNNQPENLRWVSAKGNADNAIGAGAPKGRVPWNIGLPRTKETKARIAAGRVGKHWYNNGIQEIFVAIQPSGFVSGRLTKRDKECLKLLES